MNKDDLQKLYAEIKANKSKVAAKNDTLLTPPVKKGCGSCGKVTWKPKKKSI
ncbi:hypothetical protein KUV80_06465 [Fictibacillus nanhaiensis]|uniref:hypothetical protein n=1 Tax=Fictibacillus nanhaiensis TaxID=742169 RepID=UPI001C9480BD|nr:hypothetical protein [Fictibacillus nanhaiensis]MBY6036286.1 hypothetical protein [Fictibacillus nanhaiensis]